MIEPENVLETGAASTVAGDVSIVAHVDVTKAASIEATKATERVPINPDDLHDLFEGPESGNESDPEDPFAQMRNDPNYAALMKDLEAIAEAARQLFETDEAEPSDDVWNKIQKELKTDPK